jgi:hypothetical protein
LLDYQIMMEGTGKDLALSNTGNSDADSAEKYGKLLYTLKAVPVESSFLKTQMVMKFYQDVIVFQKDSVFCWCCPKFYEQNIFPKYKLKDVHVSKGDPIKEITWGSVLLVVGLYLTGDYKDVAYAFIAVALIFWIIPFFCYTYQVHFRFTDKKDMGLAALFRDICMPMSFVNSVFAIETREEPNSNFLFDYCYGGLGKNMDEMHLLHHLIHDDITQVVKPDAFDDISDKSALLSSAGDASGMGGEISSAKFGAPVFKLVSEVTGSVYQNKTNVSFFDQVVVFQEEKKILCWPMWFSQRVVPKYKFKSFNVSKDDPIMATILGFACVGLGVVFIEALKSKALGGFLCFMGVVFWIIPFVFSTYNVNFILTHSKDFGISRALRDCLSGWFPLCVPNTQSETLTLRMSVQPDEAQIKAYVFGPVVKNMETIHTLSHLIHDDIVEVMAPTKLSDVCL